MHAIPINGSIFALLNLGGGEIILILALVLILFGAKKLPDLARGLGTGIDEFRKAIREVTDEVAQSSYDAGQSLGGIHGRRAAEALTPDNQVAELYAPAVFEDAKSRGARAHPWYRSLGRRVRAIIVWLICKLRVD